MDGDPTPRLGVPADLPGQRERQTEDSALQQQELRALRVKLARRDRELREARAVLGLVLRSRVYRLLRFLGRWEWLERRIRRVLRQG